MTGVQTCALPIYYFGRKGSTYKFINGVLTLLHNNGIGTNDSTYGGMLDDTYVYAKMIYSANLDVKNINTGALIRSVAITNDYTDLNMTIDDDTGDVYVSGAGGLLRRYKKGLTSQVWSVTLPQTFVSSNLIFVNGYLYLMQVQTSTIWWAKINPANGAVVTTNTTLLFIGTSRNRIYAVPNDGLYDIMTAKKYDFNLALVYNFEQGASTSDNRSYIEGSIDSPYVIIHGTRGVNIGYYIINKSTGAIVKDWTNTVEAGFGSSATNIISRYSRINLRDSYVRENKNGEVPSGIRVQVSLIRQKFVLS